MSKILVINGGSSSIKFKVYDSTSMISLCQGLCERIFVDGRFKLTYLDLNTNSENEIELETDFPNHDVAVEFLLNKLVECKIIDSIEDIKGVGHRVVQGADDISQSVIVDEEVENIIEKNIELAPLHNKPELDIIKIIKNKLPNSVNVGVFDSAFHTSVPSINSTYAIPKQWREELKVKRYGAHGTSYRYILEKSKSILNKDNLNLIVCHLGNGASICAIKDSKSFNTSMGFTPLEGLIMGTRSGDIDPSIFKYISNKLNIDASEIDKILNYESGVKGLCGYSDFRDITSRSQPGNEYEFTLDLFAKRVVDYIVRYTNDLDNKVDALVFCGGIGENVSIIREKIINSLKVGNYHIDSELNKQKNEDYLKISKHICKHSKNIFVIKTDEELMIANDVKKIANL